MCKGRSKTLLLKVEQAAKLLRKIRSQNKTKQQETHHRA